MNPGRVKSWGLAVFLILALLFGGILSLGIGTAPIPPNEVIHALLGKETPGATDAIVRHIRLPRLTLAILVGAALAVAGVAMQGFFQNPMADPYIVGVSSGAALGATIGMVFRIDFWFAGLSAIPILAFAGALGTTFLVYALSLRGGRVPVVLLLLIGVPLERADHIPRQFHNVVYYVVTTYAAVLCGLVVTTVLMLYRTVSETIEAIGLAGDDHYLIRTDDD